MTRALARRNFVGMAGFEGEFGRPVMQNDPGISGHHARAENIGNAGDERDGISVLVDHREIGRIAGNAPGGGTGDRLVHSHEVAPRCDEAIGQQLLDLHLPDMHGDQVLSELKAEPATAAIPVVVLSADASRGVIHRLLASGALAYLTKPIELAELGQLLDTFAAAQAQDQQAQPAVRIVPV